VRSGDTLGGIAEKVDVPVDRILELNPKVDPQSLRAGQRLKLRE
jgi:LysM repeat protein